MSSHFFSQLHYSKFGISVDIVPENKSNKQIFVGTSGYSYDDWRNVFYPRDLKENQFLLYYKRYFKALEINFTYYKIPKIKQIKQMVDQTEAQLIFTVKAHRSITHEQGDPASIAAFIETLKPMMESSTLGCVLLQFPFSFRLTDANWKRLDLIISHMKQVKVVVEFRNNDWITEATFNRLAQINAGMCSVDEPELKGLIGRELFMVSNVAYIRFHGRNATKWWEHEEAHERYDYKYSIGELTDWVPRLKAASKKVESVYAFFNNHYRGQAVQNAQLLMAFLLD
jgi:uncharacterized protein YecE (DUF72 family)